MHQNFPTELIHRRIAFNLRLIDVSKISGLSIPTVRLLEQGRGNISSLQAYLAALRLRLCWIGVDSVNHGATLAARRKRQGLSQRALAAKLAAKVEVSHRTIIALENEFRGRVDTLMQALAVLRLNPRVMNSATIGPIDDH